MIVLDVETSGIVPRKHAILSLGAIDFNEPSNQFYDECYVFDGAHIDDEALAVNGFSRAEATDSSKKTEEELVRGFIAWALDKPRDLTLAGQNPSFDRDFVAAACERAGIAFPFPFRTIDTHSLCWLHMVERGTTPPMARRHTAISLNVALEYCGLPKEQRPHNALGGAYAHAEVIARIAYNKKLLPDYDTYKIPWMKKTF